MADMYQSPVEISQIQEDLNIAFEDGVFKAVRRVGINVDKEELFKALAYDRGQYERGYHDALKEQPQWISVKDRMPAETHSMFYKFYGTLKWRDAMWREESDHVLVAITFEDGSQFVTSGYTQDGKWSTGISKVLQYTVTHWMPLPEPPEVKQDD